jgi:RNA polymerase sigma-70 factor (ECF subfamily)
MGASLRAKLEPDDVLQDVYFHVLRRLDQFQGRVPDTFFNWVLTILDSRLVDTQKMLHRRKRDVSREASPRPVPAAESYFNLLERLQVDSLTPSRAVRREEAIDALRDCLSKLSESHRNVLQLRFLEGRSVEDVAARLGKSEAAVVALTRRALEALGAMMNRLGEFTRGA